MFDVDVDLEADNVARPSPSAPRCSSRRLSFPPRQAESEAYIGEIDDGIKDTHLQHDLKRHPSTQAWKGQVCSYFPSICRSSLCLYIYIYITCPNGQLFFDLEHRVLIGSMVERCGLCFLFACSMPLLMCAIVPS